MPTNDTTPAGDILVLADDEMSRDLATNLPPNRAVCVDDPYDVLLELARRECAAVVMTAPRDEMESFARAVRRLNDQARLLMVFPDRDAQGRATAEGIADACCPYPPTRAELNLLLRGLAQREPVGPRPTVLTADAICRLISATQSLQTLEEQLAAVISESLGAEVRWVVATECPKGVEPLLYLEVSPARVLVPQRPMPFDESFDAVLNDLHQLLPVLTGMAQRTQSLHRLAITDHLTGAYNRRYFYHLAENVLRRADHPDFRAALLLYDIDDFKRYNDKFGHAAGDEILRDTAVLIRQVCREQDIVARIGGDEFAVLFWDFRLRAADSQPLRDAWELSHRFRQAVERLDLKSLGPKAAGSLTISGGLASFPENGRTVLDLLRQADRALRVAKESGKNSIRLVGQGGSPE
jgi:diguanylate cyclase (GGDEF)-like protein